MWIFFIQILNIKMPKRIISNSIRTPDGTVISSNHRHDYNTHEDNNGEMYVVDGGLDYIKRNVNVVPAEELSLYDDSPYELIRENMVRWNQRTSTYVLICDIDDSWLNNIIEHYIVLDDNAFILEIALKERAFRRELTINSILK
jgi:hypothetical protein